LTAPVFIRPLDRAVPGESTKIAVSVFSARQKRPGRCAVAGVGQHAAGCAGDAANRLPGSVIFVRTPINS
jgi:hypothetical protein